MMPDDPVQDKSYKLAVGKDGTVGVQFLGRIDHHMAAGIIKSLKAEVEKRRPVKVIADLNRVTYFDDFGVLVLSELRSHLAKNQIPFSLIQPPPKSRRGAGPDQF